MSKSKAGCLRLTWSASYHSHDLFNHVGFVEVCRPCGLRIRVEVRVLVRGRPGACRSVRWIQALVRLEILDSVSGTICRAARGP